MLVKGDNSILGEDTSIWLATTPETDFPALEGDVTVDVAIVGGGIAGLSTAYFLIKAGLKVAVLESERIATGTTGYTTGKITSAHGLIYHYLFKKFGKTKAAYYAEANETALRKMIEIMDEEGIDADQHELPAYTYSISRDDIDDLRNEVIAAKNLDLPVSFVTETPLPYHVTGAIKYENQARYHPRKYLLGLADRIFAQGGLIYEGTKVLKINEGKTCVIETGHGKVLAKQVVVATNYPIYDPDTFFARLSVRQSLDIAILLNSAVPEGMFYSTEKSFHSLRPQPFDGGEAMLVGGELFKTGQGGDITKSYENIIQWARDHFDVKEVLFHWTTNDSETYDRVPLIGPIDSAKDNIYLITGFSGWGMTHGTVAGMIIRDLILGQPNVWETLYHPKRLSTLISEKALAGDLNVAKNYIAGKIAGEPKKISLGKDEAGIFEVDGKKVAAYCDEAGATHAISAICTHMGCVVNWDGAEKTWDCPCHGSRYDVDGHVIHGPAIKNLKKIDL